MRLYYERNNISESRRYETRRSQGSVSNSEHQEAILRQSNVFSLETSSKV